MDIWTQVAFLVLGLVGGGAAGLLALMLGGYGGLKILGRRLEDLEMAQLGTQSQLVREVKTRAGLAAASARSDKAVQSALSDEEIDKEAQGILRDAAGKGALPAAPAASQRPSVLNLRR